MSKKILTRILSESDVRTLLTPERCVVLQQEVLRSKIGLRPHQDIRSSFLLPKAGLRINVIAGSGVDGASAGCKVISASGTNRAVGLPTAMSVYMLHEVPSGRVTAIVSSTYLTNLRTGATAAIAILTLRPFEERRLGVLGTGPVAAAVLTALASQESGWDVLVHSPNPEHRNAFAAEFAGRGDIEVRAIDDPRAVACRPVVVTATDGRGPAVESSWLSSAKTVVSVASRATVAEIPPQALASRRLVVDDRVAAMTDAAEFASLSSTTDLLELGEILAGTASGRANDDEAWFFKSTGLPAQDVATVSAVVTEAAMRGFGHEVPLGF